MLAGCETGLTVTATRFSVALFAQWSILQRLGRISPLHARKLQRALSTYFCRSSNIPGMLTTKLKKKAEGQIYYLILPDLLILHYRRVTKPLPQVYDLPGWQALFS